MYFRKPTLFIFAAIFGLISSASALASDKVVHIYQDADISSHNESSVAIQMGIEQAFAEVGNKVGGFDVKFKYLDHRGNVIRSFRNFQTFIDDPKALAIYSGIHSPPLIKNRSFINENKALTLVPWAAGSPITRHPSKENWIFRLSIDDAQAGEVLINHAMEALNCRAPNLLLESTPWGDSNLRSMTAALKSRGMTVPDVTRFNWNLKKKGARAILRSVNAKDNDCLIYVGNAVEGAIFAKEMVTFPAELRVPIISHWGITGGNFHEEVPAAEREKIDLHFIQTCFAFSNPEQSPLAQRVFNELKEKSEGKITKPADLKAAVGFIHGYDLTKLLITAIEETGLTGDIARDRDAVRRALENIQKPVEGLVKTYETPFTVFDADTAPNAHEALGREHYCMGQYSESDEIILSK